MKFNWGTGMVLVLVVFMAGIGVMVYIAFKNNINLVHEDYYPRELAHQTMIDKRNNALALPKQVSIEYDSDYIEVGFPDFFNFEKIKGEIHLFRPSSGIKDLYFLINPDSLGKQQIPTAALDKGKYIVKVEWEFDNIFYYTEKNVYINNNPQ
jgi:hypothetical protein